jgi:hypothetical protein
VLPVSVQAAGGELNPAFAQSVSDCLASLTVNSALDREELQALWWTIGGYSNTEEKPFKALDPATAGLIAGLELSEIVTGPGTRGLGKLASRVADLSPATEAKNFVELVEPVDESSWARCTSTVGAGQLDKRELCFPLLSAAASTGHNLPAMALMSPTISHLEIAIQMYSERCLLNTLVA